MVGADAHDGSPLSVPVRGQRQGFNLRVLGIAEKIALLADSQIVFRRGGETGQSIDRRRVCRIVGKNCSKLRSSFRTSLQQRQHSCSSYQYFWILRRSGSRPLQNRQRFRVFLLPEKNIGKTGENFHIVRKPVEDNHVLGFS